MNWRRLGVALMLVGVLFGATGTYSAISIDADRGFDVGAATDELDDKNANYFDVKDMTDPDNPIRNNSWGTSVLRVYNQFGRPLTATDVSITEVTPVNASANETTTDSSAVVPLENAFSSGTTIQPKEGAPVRARCNPDFDAPVDAEHEITVSIVVENSDSGTTFSLDRTVTAPIECNS